MTVEFQDNESPRIIGWSGPARSGTTGLLFLLASHPGVDKAYFQPLKTAWRTGKHGFKVSPNHKTICLKEVFRGCCPARGHDPLAALLQIGVPANQISWVSILREPVSNYDSWVRVGNKETPEEYAQVQEYSLNLFNKYRKLGVKMVPFAYELLARNEASVLNSLLHLLGLSPVDDLSFNKDAIKQKLDFGEAAEKNYFNNFIKDTYQKSKFVYSPRQPEVLSKGHILRVKRLAQKRYDDFYELARNELKL